MTNETLAAQAQGGNCEALLTLWSQVQRLVCSQARRWAGRGGTTLEDLTQAGFIATLRAAGSYDPTQAQFSTWLFPFLRAEFAIATGQHRRRTALDPVNSAVSLDAPLTDDSNDLFTLADVVEDTAAREELSAVDEQDRLERLHSALETALSTLSETERRIIIAHFYQGQTVAEIAAAEGVSRNVVSTRERKALLRLRHPSRSKMLTAYL